MARGQPDTTIPYCYLNIFSKIHTVSYCFCLGDVVSHEPITVKEKKKKLCFNQPSLLHRSLESEMKSDLLK